MDNESVESLLAQPKDQFSGNILLFYAFDVGDDIDLSHIQHKGLVDICSVPLSAYFKNYHLHFTMDMILYLCMYDVLCVRVNY